jgi:hypothetical protein
VRESSARAGETARKEAALRAGMVAFMRSVLRRRRKRAEKLARVLVALDAAVAERPPARGKRV